MRLKQVPVIHCLTFRIYQHNTNARRKEGNVLFNDALNTFYLRLYGVRHMVKDHSDSERGRKEGNVLFNDALNTFYLRLSASLNQTFPFPVKKIFLYIHYYI